MGGWVEFIVCIFIHAGSYILQPPIMHNYILRDRILEASLNAVIFVERRDVIFIFEIMRVRHVSLFKIDILTLSTFIVSRTN